MPWLSKKTDRTDGGWVQSTFGAKAEVRKHFWIFQDYKSIYSANGVLQNNTIWGEFQTEEMGLI